MTATANRCRTPGCNAQARCVYCWRCNRRRRADNRALLRSLVVRLQLLAARTELGKSEARVAVLLECLSRIVDVHHEGSASPDGRSVRVVCSFCDAEGEGEDQEAALLAAEHGDLCPVAVHARGGGAA